MRILFDQGTPVPLRHFLSEHEVTTAFELGWAQLQNGDLLSAAENAGFEIFITTDKNLQYQQNLTARVISIIVLGATSWPRIQKITPAILTTVSQAKPNSYIEVFVPHM